MNHLPIIGLAGQMESGKDTAAGYLKRHGYDRIAFADALREEVLAAVQKREIPEAANWEIRLALDSVKPSMVYSKPTDDNMRKILQWWGTEYRRAQDQDYWIKRLIERMDITKDWVISDVRFPNEAEFVRNCGGEVWLIERAYKHASGFRVGPSEPGFRGHASERLHFKVDRTIPNDSLDRLGPRLSDAYYAARAA